MVKVDCLKAKALLKLKMRHKDDWKDVKISGQNV